MNLPDENPEKETPPRPQRPLVDPPIGNPDEVPDRRIQPNKPDVPTQIPEEIPGAPGHPNNPSFDLASADAFFNSDPIEEIPYMGSVQNLLEEEFTHPSSLGFRVPHLRDYGELN